mmetsp:Transcript_5564/g.9540  ORF Transcript_5564/g.9540 Transcript_5564/m.9540 type:complete len:151 (+) Transcript_5564:1971-2423(+)
MELIVNYYENKLSDFDNIKFDEAEEYKRMGQAAAEAKDNEQDASLKSEKLKPKKNILPILQKLSERKPAKVNYVGTSFGLTKELFQFWRKSMFVPVYLRQTANELTGEHTCLMIRPINLDDQAVAQLALEDGLGEQPDLSDVKEVEMLQD